MCSSDLPQPLAFPHSVCYHNREKSHQKGTLTMQLLLIHYPKCSTCQKARRWLEAHSIPFESRHIAEDPPTRQELAHWAQHLPLKRL